MAKIIAENTELGKLVARFLVARGINRNDVQVASIDMEGGRPALVTIKMYYDEFEPDGVIPAHSRERFNDALERVLQDWNMQNDGVADEDEIRSMFGDVLDIMAEGS